MIIYTDLKTYIQSNQIEDVKKSYLKLLTQLALTQDIETDLFINNINKIYENGIIYIAYEDKNIIASGTVFIETKIIHTGKNVAHIEDIVVDIQYRKLGISAKIIELIKKFSFMNNCYKCILDCHSDLIPFYIKNGFINKNTQMSLYFI